MKSGQVDHRMKNLGQRLEDTKLDDGRYLRVYGCRHEVMAWATNPAPAACPHCT